MYYWHKFEAKLSSFVKFTPPIKLIMFNYWEFNKFVTYRSYLKGGSWMVINKIKNENKVGTHRPCICKTKMFSTIQYLFDWLDTGVMRRDTMWFHFRYMVRKEVRRKKQRLSKTENPWPVGFNVAESSESWAWHDKQSRCRKYKCVSLLTHHLS